MNNPEPRTDNQADDPEDPPSPGPNLILLYSLIALALAAAIGFALLIVFPFYRRQDLRPGLHWNARKHSCNRRRVLALQGRTREVKP